MKGNSPLFDVQNNLSNQKNLVVNAEVVKSNQIELKAYSESPNSLVDKLNRCNVDDFTFLNAATKNTIEKCKPFKKIEDIAPILKDTIKYNSIIKILQRQL